MREERGGGSERISLQDVGERFLHQYNNLVQVVFNLQWLADAMASIVGLLTKDEAQQNKGFLDVSEIVKRK